MKQKENPKRRANKIFVKFANNLLNQALNGLVNEVQFMGKFTTADIIKHNDNVIGIHVIDAKKINYSISVEGIEAFSLYLRDKIVKQQLEKFTNELLTKVGRGKGGYTIDDSSKHEFIQDFEIQRLFNKKFVDGLNEVFKNKGYENPVFQSRIMIEKNNKPVGIISIYYPDQESYKKREVLIEARSDLIKEILGIVKAI